MAAQPQDRIEALPDTYYRDFLDAVDQGFCIVQLLFDEHNTPVDYCFVEMNATFEQQTGLHQALGKTARELVPDLEAHWFELYGRVALTGQPVRFENGSEAMGRWFDVYAFRVGPAENHLVALLFKDITESKRTEVTLARVTGESEQQRRFYETIISSTPDLVYVFDLNYRFTFVNDALLHMWGRTLADSTGKSLLEIGYEPWHAAMHEREIDQVVATKQSIRGEVPFRHAELGWRIYDYIFVPVLNAAGDVIAIAGTTRDVTERKANEEALRQSEERLRLAVAATGLGIFDWDLTTDEVRANARFREMLGLPAGEEVIGQALLGGIVHPEDRDFVNARITAACDPASEGRYEFEHRAITSKGELWLVTFGQVYFAGEGADRRAVRIIGNDLDITERKRAEESLRASEQNLRRLSQSLEERVVERTAELEAINRELDQFTYVASHDLRAPLRAVKQLASWIVEDSGTTLPATAQAHLNKLQARIQRMETLLHDLRVYSRAGRQRHALEEIDAGVLVHHIVEMLAPPPGFVIEVAAAMPQLRGERVALETVLRNLITNAIKHHDRPTAGRVVLSVQELGEFIEFTVHDNGPGIAPAFHARIFEMFQTLRPRDEVEGSGIGLALVKRHVESRGGTVSVESNNGQGATFRFTWPRIQTKSGTESSVKHALD